MLDWLLEGYLKHFLVHHLDDEVQVLLDLHVLFLDDLLFRMVLLHQLVMLSLSLVLQLFLLRVRVMSWSCRCRRLELLRRFFRLLLVKTVRPFVFKLFFVDVLNLHFDVGVSLEVVENLLHQLISDLVNFEVEVAAFLRPARDQASTGATLEILEIVRVNLVFDLFFFHVRLGILLLFFHR